MNENEECQSVNDYIELKQRRINDHIKGQWEYFKEQSKQKLPGMSEEDFRKGTVGENVKD